MGRVWQWSRTLTPGDEARKQHSRNACCKFAAHPQLIAALSEDAERDTSYRRVGAMLVSADLAELDRVEVDVRALATHAAEAGAVTRLPAAEARGLFPPLRQDLQAIHIAGGARVDGRKLAAALRGAAVRHGMKVWHDRAALLVAGGRARGVTCGGTTVGADAVVLTAGAWAAGLAGEIGLRLPIEPQRGQIIHLRMADVDTSAWPVISPLADHYMLAFDDSRVVVGATRETGSGFDYRVTAVGVASVLNNALSIAPGLGVGTMLETRVGFRPMIAGDRPILGAAPDVAGLFVGNGLGPAGLTLGPVAGRLLAQAVLGQATDLDLRPYSWTVNALDVQPLA